MPNFDARFAWPNSSPSLGAARRWTLLSEVLAFKAPISASSYTTCPQKAPPQITVSCAGLSAWMPRPERWRSWIGNAAARYRPRTKENGLRSETYGKFLFADCTWSTTRHLWFDMFVAVRTEVPKRAWPSPNDGAIRARCHHQPEQRRGSPESRVTMSLSMSLRTVLDKPGSIAKGEPPCCCSNSRRLLEQPTTRSKTASTSSRKTPKKLSLALRVLGEPKVRSCLQTASGVAPIYVNRSPFRRTSC